MMRQEFEQRIGSTISDKDYDLIELVYTWHPAISNADGKNQMASLYMNYGMTVIKDMVARSIAVCDLDKRLREAESKVAAIQEEIEGLSI